MVLEALSYTVLRVIFASASKTTKASSKVDMIVKIDS